MSSGSLGSGASIQVTHRGGVVRAIQSLGWRVFIDGVWVGGAPRGKTVTFAVSPGHHVVKIWSHRGGTCSNELALEVNLGSTRSLTCRVRRNVYGFSNLPTQMAIIRDGVKTGVSEMIVLSEV